MAEPAAFPEANDVLRAPPGMEDVVTRLPIRRADGCVISCWRFSAEEIAEILRTGVAWLAVMGQTHPPLMVSGRREDMI